MAPPRQSDSPRYTVWAPANPAPRAWCNLSWEDVKRVVGATDDDRPRVDADVWPRAIVIAGCTIEREGAREG